MSGFDLGAAVLVHPNYIDEIGVLGELRRIGGHVVPVPAVRKRSDDVRDLGCDISGGFSHGDLLEHSRV
jgi:hypothetical protein